MPGMSIRVNGPCLIQVAFASSTNPFGSSSGKNAKSAPSVGGLKDLGISENGVDVAVILHDSPIMTDAAGERVPAELQDQGKEADISARLVSWDDDILDQMIQRDAANPGEVGSVGYPLGLGGNSFRVVLTSDWDRPYRFFNCILRGPQRTRLGTKYKPFDIRLYAWALVGSGKNAYGTKLYDRTAG